MRSLLTGLVLGIVSCGEAQERQETRRGREAPSTPLVDAARSQVGKTTIYDGSYVGLKYPGGDVPIERGVCTDVVIRALRGSRQMDLQKLVHEDMKGNFGAL